MLSQDLRDKIKESYRTVKSYRGVARIFNVHHYTVKQIVDGMHVEDKSHVGRKRKTTRRDESKIERAHRRISASGARVTARKVQSACDLTHLCTRTIQRRSKEKGLEYIKPKIQIVHTPEHLQNRLQFARAALTNMDQFKRVVWTDEKRFNSDGPDHWYSWMPRNARTVRNKRQQGGPSLQVYGMLIPGPLLVVFELPPRGDSQAFMEFMEEQVLPAIRALYGDDFVLQQDRNPTHTSVYSRAKFADLEVELLDWPSRSPDLNLIENCWSMISNIVYDGRQYENKCDLWTGIDAAVSHINAHMQGALNNIFASLGRRFLECVDLKGGLTHY